MFDEPSTGSKHAVKVKRFLHLLRHQRTHEAGFPHRVHEDLVRPEIKVLDLLALDIHLSGVPQLPNERRSIHLTRDHLGGKADLREDGRKVTV